MVNEVTIREAVAHSTLSYQQISNLARRGKIKARKSGSTWIIDLDSLKAHEEEMARLGNAKHNPHGSKN